MYVQRAKVDSDIGPWGLYPNGQRRKTVVFPRESVTLARTSSSPCLEHIGIYLLPLPFGATS